MQERKLDKELAALESELAVFRPSPSRLDRDRAIFLAGKSAGHVSPEETAHTTAAAWPWQTAFAVMTTVAGGLLIALIAQNQTPQQPQVAQPIPPVVETESTEPIVDEPEPPAEPPEHDNWLPLRDHTMAFNTVDRPRRRSRHDGRLTARDYEAALNPRVEPPSPSESQEIIESPPPLRYLEHRRQLLEEMPPWPQG